MKRAEPTIDAWRARVAALAPAELADVAAHLNRAAFVRQMVDAGASDHEITAVLVALAKRFNALGLVPPSGGFVDLAWLAATQ